MKTRVLARPRELKLFHVFTLKWKLEFCFENSRFDQTESLRLFNVFENSSFDVLDCNTLFSLKVQNSSFGLQTRVLSFTWTLVQKLKTRLCSLEEENSSLDLSAKLKTRVLMNKLEFPSLSLKFEFNDFANPSCLILILSRIILYNSLLCLTTLFVSFRCLRNVYWRAKAKSSSEH